MVDAAVAGITPVEFYDLTIGEITVAIEGYQERERQTIISRISSIMRAFSKKGQDPFKGLGAKTKQNISTGGLRRGAMAWLWAPED